MYNGDPADFAAPVAPNDVTEFAQPMRSLYVGVTGNVSVLTTNGQSVIFANVPVGILPIRCRRVNSTGTTATNIIGLW
mgnify:FL=1